MTEFVRLHVNNLPVNIAVAHIISFYRSGSETYLRTVVDTEEWVVDETPEAIRKLIGLR